MNDLTTLDEIYSTTRRVIKADPQQIAGLLKQSNKPEDKFETVLFLPEGEGRQGEGGLRTRGYFKVGGIIPTEFIVTLLRRAPATRQSIDGECVIANEAINHEDISPLTESRTSEAKSLITVVTVVFNVHLGVDVLKFDLSTTERVFQRPFLLFVGARGGYKNFTSVVRSLAGSRPLREEFDLVAFGGGPFTAVESELLAHFGFGDSQVRQISGDDSVLGKLYNSAVALVYPSIYERFGMPPLEAMAGGCPVISSNSSSMPEVVNNAGLYFDPCDLDDMRNAIETVCFSSELRAKLIKAGNENVKKFSWDKCAQKTLAIYEKLAGTK